MLFTHGAWRGTEFVILCQFLPSEGVGLGVGGVIHMRRLRNQKRTWVRESRKSRLNGEGVFNERLIPPRKATVRHKRCNWYFETTLADKTPWLFSQSTMKCLLDRLTIRIDFTNFTFVCVCEFLYFVKEFCSFKYESTSFITVKIINRDLIQTIEKYTCSHRSDGIHFYF